MGEKKTIAERQSEIQAELNKAAKDARTTARNAKKEFVAERETAIANAILDGTDAMKFDIDLFLDMMASKNGQEFKESFAACYGIKDNEMEKDTFVENEIDTYDQNINYE